MIEKLLNQIKEQRQQAGIWRQRVLTPENLCNFSSNDYLCLTTEPAIQKAFAAAFKHYPISSRASLSLGGYHPTHQHLEQAFCKYLDVDDGLLFSSGYAANLSIVSLLSAINCHLVIDKSLHASFYDGIRLANAKYSRYIHNDLNDLNKKLSVVTQQKIVVTEGIFSMSGQQPNLVELSHLAKQYRTYCIVDEAHSFGVLGQHGLGAVPYYQLDQEAIPLRVIPFGKSLAAQGAIVVGKQLWIELLWQFARSNLYSTGISPAIAQGLLTSLKHVYQADDKRAKLQEIIGYFQKKIAQSPHKWRNSQTAIQQLQLGCAFTAIRYSNYLRQQGVFCAPVREPTVTRQETGLRIVLNCQHEARDIDKLFSCLDELYDIKY